MKHSLVDTLMGANKTLTVVLLKDNKCVLLEVTTVCGSLLPKNKKLDPAKLASDG